MPVLLRQVKVAVAIPMSLQVTGAVKEETAVYAPTATPDVAIIGGGMIGLSIAYALASRGASVTVVEKDDIAAGASGSNMGLVLWSDAEPGLSLDLTVRGWKRILDLQDELNFDLEFKSISSLGIIENQNDISEVQAQAALSKKAGFEAEFIDARYLCEVEPNISPGRAIGAIYCKEGRLNPFLLTSAYWSRARACGVCLKRGFEVAEIQETGGKVTRLVGRDGIISPGFVVIAAGAWTRSVFELLEIDLPQYYIHGEMLVCEQVPDHIMGLVGSGVAERVFMEKAMAESDFVLSEFTSNPFSNRKQVLRDRTRKSGGRPSFRIVEDSLTQTISGNLLLGQVSKGSGRFYNEVGHRSFTDLSHSALKYFPRLRHASVIRSWVKPVPFTPDHLPYMGPVEGYDNLFVASGYKSTIILTPLIGEILADLILNRKVLPGLEVFYPNRAGGIKHYREMTCDSDSKTICNPTHVLSTRLSTSHLSRSGEG
jgi:sarcosine oxidase subunit beta